MKRLPAVAAFVLLLAYALAFQGSRGLWEPDEGRYVAIAAQMLRSGEYMIPALNDDHPHFAKPPLTYWTIAAGIRLLGWNEWGVRLANALAFVATVLLVLAIARCVTPSEPELAAVAYAVMLVPYMAANVVTTDTLLALWETLAVAGFVAWRCAPPGASGRWQRLLMWLGFGLAFFTKGPPGVVPLLAIIVYLLARGERRAVRRLFYLPGVGIFALVGLTWYTVLSAAHPDLLTYFLRSEFLERLTTGARRRNPQWYGWIVVYLPTLLIGALPFSPILLRRLARAPRLLRRRWWRHTLATDPMGAFTVLWVVVPLVVFCTARSRLPLYILPLFVPLAVLAGRELAIRRWRSRKAIALLAVWLALLIGGRRVAASIDTPRDPRPLAARIASLPSGPTDEVVFVEHYPQWGLALYLRAEIELVEIEEGSWWWASNTLDEELDEEPDALYVVPADVLNRFVSAAGAHRLTPVEDGRFEHLVFLRLAHR